MFNGGSSRAGLLMTAMTGSKLKAAREKVVILYEGFITLFLSHGKLKCKIGICVSGRYEKCLRWVARLLMLLPIY